MSDQAIGAWIDSHQPVFAGLVAVIYAWHATGRIVAVVQQGVAAYRERTAVMKKVAGLR